MVGPSDISCFRRIVDRISDVTVDPFFQGFNYIFCYMNHVELISCEIMKLKTEENRMSEKVGAERVNGRVIKDHVLKWQDEVEEILQRAEVCSEKYKNIQRLANLDPIVRFKLSKEAVHIAKQITELSDSGKMILDDEIAHVVYLPDTDTEFQDFESRKDAYGKLWEALVSEDSPMILGICGMPGVGKTQMTKHISEQVKEREVFNKVVWANVGQKRLDLIDLQNQIAGDLHLLFESQDDVACRAFQLKNGLIDGGKILVILDDVWRNIPLYAIGLSFDDGRSSRGCKILFTSRNKYACLSNKCEHIVMLTSLTDVESWDLFRNTVGTDTIDSLQDESLAKEVCDKCGGLPLVIHEVGKALKWKGRILWMDALEHLKNGDPNFCPRVFACLKLSFDCLPEDTKACLLLCSLFPEDADIPIRNLIQLARGSQLVCDQRSGVLSMVDFLKASLLLLQGKDDQHVKLQTVIRGVASSIALSDPTYAFLFVRCSSQLTDIAHYGAAKLLHLVLESNHLDFHDLICPDLHTLWLRSVSTLEPKFSLQKLQVSGMLVNLRFLVLTNFLCKHQFSLRPLSELPSLLLEHCNLFDTDAGFFPENLYTLCIWDCRLPEKLDLPDMKYLRRLEILGGTAEVPFVPNTISRLLGLKELHIPNGLSILDDKGIWVHICELSNLRHLTRLTSLQICSSQLQAFKETEIFNQLNEYNICVGRPRDDEHFLEASSRKLIELSGYQLEGFEDLVEGAEQLTLRSTNVRMNAIFNRDRSAFTNLRYLYIVECATMEFVAKISLDSIKHKTSFNGLTILEIRRCSSIKYLFCNSVAKRLIQLQQLCITDCPLMEAIILNEGTSDTEIIHFFKLKSLKLNTMPRLTSFYKERKYMHSSSTSVPDNSFQPLFDGSAAFPSLEVLELSGLEHTTDIWAQIYHNDDNVSSFCKLKSLNVSNFNRLEIVIPVAMLNRLQNLESLHIIGCNSLISEVGTNHNNTEICELVALSQMHLELLPCLVKTGLDLCDHSRAITLYPNLSSLYIRDCSSLINVFQTSIARVLVHLKEIRVSNCAMMKEIIGAGDEEITCDVMFPKLTLLQLSRLPNLTSLRCHFPQANTYKVDLPQLVDLELSGRELDLEAIEFAGQLMCLSIGCDEEIQLPDTWKHRLNNLETLKLRHCWSHELESLCFQKLKVLRVFEYEGSSLFTFSVFRSLQHLQELEISNCGFLKEILKDARGDEAAEMDRSTITLFQLRSIILRDLPNLESLIHSACHMPVLEKVHVNNCGLSTLFTASVLENLNQLKHLRVSNCRSLESIADDSRYNETCDTNDTIIALFQLSYLVLENLPNLKSFMHSVKYDQRQMPAEVEVQNSGIPALFEFSIFKSLEQLERLEISNCALLEEIVGDIRVNEAFCMEKKTVIVILFQLRSVIFKDMPKLRNFVHSANYECHMPTLTEVVVDNCALCALFTCSIFRKFQLKYLHVSNCALLESIVEDTMADETLNSIDMSFTLFKLSYVVLKNLPNLKSFVLSGRYDQCELPAAAEFHNCGLYTLFAFSAFKSLLQLQELEISSCALLEKVVEDSRGDEVSNMERKTITLFHLRSVILQDLPNLRNFLHSANYECQIPALEKLQVNNCKLSTLFPCFVYRNLQLKDLRVSDCKLLEGIVEDARDNETSDTFEKSITLFHLSSVVLKDLPKLKKFMHGAKYECQMPALVEVEVRNCGLSTLFTTNVFKNLQLLRELGVWNCESLEGIVGDRKNYESFYTTEKNIKLPRLSKIVLENLPKLESFSPSARYAFDMSALYTFHLVGCPRLEKFTSLETTTGLVSVYTEGKCWEEVPDLNEYIRQKRRAGSNFKDTAGESSSGNQKLDKEAVIVEEEQSLQETVVIDQKVRRIELRIFINTQQEVTNTKTSVHHLTLLE